MSTATDASPQSAAEETASASKSLEPQPRRVNRGLVAVILAVLVAILVGWYIHSQGIEDTDDAQVDGHLIPISSRIDGTIQSVHVDDNQIVKAGDVLVELDPRDYRVAADQAKAQFDQATAQLGAADPNLPITRIANQADLTSGAAQVTGAEAAVASAHNDLAVAVAHLKESEAVNERAQADFQR